MGYILCNRLIACNSHFVFFVCGSVRCQSNSCSYHHHWSSFFFNLESFIEICKFSPQTFQSILYNFLLASIYCITHRLQYFVTVWTRRGLLKLFNVSLWCVCSMCCSLCFHVNFLEAEDQSVKREEEAKKRQEIFETFQNAPFEEIVARAEAKVRNLNVFCKLLKI